MRPQPAPPVAALAVSLSMGAAIALGLARFSYALLLPPMKADLGWSFAQAGALNTSNAVGYLAGALAFPLLARRWPARHLFVSGCLLTTAAMALAGATPAYAALLVQRLACGVFSALIFVGGGVLATRLASVDPPRSGLVLGLYYGGTGWGIVVSALVVPWTLSATAHGWQRAWLALAGLCALCSALAWPAAARIPDGGPAVAQPIGADPAPVLGRITLLLAGYGLFGIGYIGYMTFVIALLRQAGMSAGAITLFYVALGLATVVSGRVWSGVLHRTRGGGAFATFCLLVSVATLMPTLAVAPALAFASGIVFGATFLAVVASTTSFVRHNLPPARWAAGISVFTTVFAVGQIVGPTVLGVICDGSGLRRGFVVSAAVLLAAAVSAAGQTPLAARRAAPERRD